MSNPLLESNILPPFSQIKVEHIEPAIDNLLATNRAGLKQLLETQRTFSWDTLVAPIEDAEDRLSQSWSPVGHLNAVMNSNPLREVYERCVGKLSDYNTEMGQNAALYQAYLRLTQRDDYEDLQPAQHKVVEDAIRDFRLSGVALPETQKQRFKAIQQRLSQLTTQFENNVLDATLGWHYHTDNAAELSGLPEHVLLAAQQSAESQQQQGYRLSLDFPTYYAVMSYADNSKLRETFYQAYCTRASDQGPQAGQWDNSPLMVEILQLRQEMAFLLGFKNFAEYSLASKMANSVEQVLQFLRDLAQRSKDMAEQELLTLQAFAKQHYGITSLQAWDIGYYSEKYRQREFDISQEALRPYFPVPQVLQGLFSLMQRVFGFEIKARQDVATWHPDVQFFDIFDKSLQLRGSFYIDLYARPHKRGGAWMDDCRTRRRLADGSIQQPVAYLTCNFTPPLPGKTALLSHEEVETLFHEFGHTLHHLVSQVDFAAVSGIHGVAWDAVELPSQFMENFCWRKETIELISGHVDTGAKLPDALFQRLLKLKTFQSGLQMLRQAEFALLDFLLHSKSAPHNVQAIQAELNLVRAEVSVLIPPAYNRFQHSFSHIFAGGYAAGYYSYKWAEVLSSDAFSRFEQEGLFNPKVGQDFLKLLEAGGSADPMDLFIEFRGREPTIDALLKHSGIR